MGGVGGGVGQGELGWRIAGCSGAERVMTHARGAPPHGHRLHETRTCTQEIYQSALEPMDGMVGEDERLASSRVVTYGVPILLPVSRKKLEADPQVDCNHTR